MVSVDFVLFGVGADKPDPADLIFKTEFYDQPIIVAFYIENDSVVL